MVGNNVEVLKKKLPKQYDLILVDGPLGRIGRKGFFTNISLFNTNVPIIFDDVNRRAEFDLMFRVAKFLKRNPLIFTTSEVKKFGVMFTLRII